MYSISASLFWSTIRTPLRHCPRHADLRMDAPTVFMGVRLSASLRGTAQYRSKQNAISLTHTPLWNIVANNLPPNPRCASLSSNHEYDDVMAWRHGLALTQ
jgi:hypothetical protein